MNTNALDMFFQLIRLGLGTDKSLEGDFASIDWEEIYQLGVRQGVAPVQFDGLQRLFEEGVSSRVCMPAPALKLKWFGHARQVEGHCSLQFQKAAALADIYAAHGIRTVVLKGIAAGTNYPVPNHRPCGDLDCFLMGDYERGNVIAQESGAAVERDFYKHSHISFKGLAVENHQFCTAIRGSKRAKAFERLLQSLLKEEGTTNIGDTNLENPSAMFNALFLTHHAYRHFLSEGIVLRHLCDWAMLLHRQGDKLDWPLFQEHCNTYGLERFAASMTRLAEKMLHVKVPTMYQIEKNDKLDDYLLHEMLFGENSTAVGSGWERRWKMIKDISGHRKRHEMFSDTSFLQELLQLAYGFCFDRTPRL